MKNNPYGKCCGFFLAFCLLLLALALPQSAQAKAVEVGNLNELVAALNGSHSGETILVTQDIKGELAPKEKPFPSVPYPSGVKINGACTLDLGGRVVEVTLSQGSDFIGVATNGSLTVQNGKLKVLCSGYSSAIASTGKLTLNDVTIVGGDGLFLHEGSETNIKKAHLKGTLFSGLACFGDFLSIDGSELIGKENGIYFGDVPPMAEIRLTGSSFYGPVASMKVVKGAVLKSLIPDGVTVKVDDVATLLSNETELKGTVKLGKISGFYLDIGAHLQMATAIGQPVPAGQKLGVRVVDVPTGKQVKAVLLNDAPITATKDADGVYHFEMPDRDSALEVTFEDGPTPPPTEDLLTSIFKIGDKRVEINNKGVQSVVTMDVAPYIKNGRTMLPVRFVGESLNMKVDFDENTRNVTVKGPTRTITLNLESDQATVDGENYKLDSKPENIAGRTMLPIGEIADLIGLSRKPEASPTGNLHWDDVTRTVRISVPAA